MATGLEEGRPGFTVLGFILLEIWVVSAKQEALQALGIPKNVFGNALTLHFEKIGRPVSRTSETRVNQRIRPCQLGVRPGNRPKRFELLDPLLRLRSEAGGGQYHADRRDARPKSFARDFSRKVPGGKQ